MLHHRLERLGQKLLDLLVLHHLQRRQRQPRYLLAQQLAIGRRGEPVGQRLRRVMALYQRHQRWRIQKLVAHKDGQVLANAVLVARDDGRVPPHHGQRNMAKQGRDGKPVGQCADHGCLADGAQADQPQRHLQPVNGPARTRQRRSNEAGCDGQQKNQWQALGLLQRQALFWRKHDSKHRAGHAPCQSRKARKVVALNLQPGSCLRLRRKYRPLYPEFQEHHDRRYPPRTA